MRPKFSRCIRSTRRACGGVRDDFRSAITRSFQR
jgi:hypothetical protein